MEFFINFASLQNTNFMLYYNLNKGNIMAKVKILKKLPKSKTKKTNSSRFLSNPSPKSQFAKSYLEFYDDVKVPGKRYDW